MGLMISVITTQLYSCSVAAASHGQDVSTLGKPWAHKALFTETTDGQLGSRAEACQLRICIDEKGHILQLIGEN